MNNIQINSVGDRLRFLRKSKGLSQGAMANLLETPTSSYKNYELNKSAIPHTVLEKFVKETNTTFDFLIMGRDLLKEKDETILNIRHNTQFDTKIDNDVMVLTIRIPLLKYIGA